MKVSGLMWLLMVRIFVISCRRICDVFLLSILMVLFMLSSKYTATFSFITTMDYFQISSLLFLFMHLSILMVHGMCVC